MQRYDPYYSAKMQALCGEIGRLRQAKRDGIEFHEPELSQKLGFYTGRMLQVLVKRGHLIMDDNPGRARGYGRDSRRWPPSQALFERPVGFTFVTQMGFRYGLRGYVDQAINQLENHAALLHLEDIRSSEGASEIGWEPPHADGNLEFTHRSERGSLGRIKVDFELLNRSFDLSRMDLKWVEATRDTLFAQLEPAERHLLYLVYHEDMSAAQIAKATGQTEPEVSRQLEQILDDLRCLAGVEEED